MNEQVRNIIVVAIAVVLIIFLAGEVLAAPAPKYFVCKYVGTPGDDERLQTGNNPISVSGNALPDGTQVGDSFADAQGRSYVVAEDTGQEEPECPVPENPEEPEEPEKPEVPQTPEPETPEVEAPTVQTESTNLK